MSRATFFLLTLTTLNWISAPEAQQIGDRNDSMKISLTNTDRMKDDNDGVSTVRAINKYHGNEMPPVQISQKTHTTHLSNNPTHKEMTISGENGNRFVRSPGVMMGYPSDIPEPYIRKVADCTFGDFIPSIYCNKYYRCTGVRGQMISFNCPSTLVWNKQILSCDYPYKTEETYCTRI